MIERLVLFLLLASAVYGQTATCSVEYTNVQTNACVDGSASDPSQADFVLGSFTKAGSSYNDCPTDPVIARVLVQVVYEKYSEDQSAAAGCGTSCDASGNFNATRILTQTPPPGEESETPFNDETSYVLIHGGVDIRLSSPKQIAAGDFYRGQTILTFHDEDTGFPQWNSMLALNFGINNDIRPSQAFTGLIGEPTAGDYSIRVSDVEAFDPTCHRSATITVWSELIVFFTAVSPPTCNGLSDASFTINVCGGSGTYNFVNVEPSLAGLSQVQSGAQNVDNALGGTTYTFTVAQDSDSFCVQTGSITTPPRPIIEPSYTTFPPDCSGDDGLIQWSAIGGTGLGFTLHYRVESADPNDPFIANAANSVEVQPGSYEVYVADSNNCESIRTTVTVPTRDPVDFSTVETGEVCGDDGELRITPSGGVSPYPIISIIGINTGTSDSGNSNGDPITFSPLPGDTYTISVADSFGCTTTNSAIVSSVPTPSFSIGTITPPTCDYQSPIVPVMIGPNGPDRMYTISFTGASPCIPSAQTGSLGETIEFNSGLCVDTAYSVTITDPFCSYAPLGLTTPSAVLVTPQIAVTPTAPTCNGESTGKIIVNPMNADVDLILETSSGSEEGSVDGVTSGSSHTFNGLSAGDYTVIANTTGSPSCMFESDTVTIPSGPTFEITISGTKDVTCPSNSAINEVADGEIVVEGIDINTISCTGAHTCTVTSTSGNTIVFGNLEAATYSVTATSDGCSTTQDDIIVKRPDDYTFSVQTYDLIDSTFTGGAANCKGSYVVKYQGGKYTSEQTTQMTGLPVGQNNFNINDDPCDFEIPITIESISPTVDFIPTSPSCNSDDTGPDNDGKITITFDTADTKTAKKFACAANDATPTNFQDITASASISCDITGLSAATHDAELHLQRVGPCIVSSDIIVSSPEKFQFSNTTTAEAKCDGDQVTVEVNLISDYGRDTTIQFNSETPSPVEPPNSASLTIQEGNPIAYLITDGVCSQADNIANPDITEFEVKEITITKANCKNEEAVVVIEVQGGIAPYGVGENIATGTTISPTDAEYTFEVGEAGTYDFKLEDSKECIITASDIEVQAKFTTLEVTDLTCSNSGTLEVCVADENEFTVSDWDVTGSCSPTVSVSNPCISITNILDDCTLTITAKDALNCELVTSSTVSYADASPINYVVMPENPICLNGDDGSVTVTITSDPNDDPPPNLTFEVRITSPSDSVTNADQTTGSDTSIEGPAGAYTIVVTDSIGCEKQTDVTLSDGGQSQIDQLDITSATCNPMDGPPGLVNDGRVLFKTISPLNGAKAVLTYPNGTTVEFNNNEQHDVTGLAAGTYTLTATDSQCPPDVQAFTIQSKSDDLVLDYTGTSPSCATGQGVSDDGSAFVTVQGGLGNIALNCSTLCSTGTRGHFNISNLEAGSFTFVATDENSCQDLIDVVISPASLIDLSIDDISCSTEAFAKITVSGGSSPYNITKGTDPILTNVSPGSYDMSFGSETTIALVATDSNDCLASANRDLSIVNPVDLTVDFTDPLCYGNDGTIEYEVKEGQPPYTVTVNSSPISPSTGTISRPAGSYEFMVTDSSGCSETNSTTIMLSNPDELKIVISNQVNPTCANDVDGQYRVTISGGTFDTTTPRPPPNVKTDLAAGTYVETIQDANGCTDTISIDLANPPVLSVMLRPTAESCSGTNDGSLVIDPDGGISPYSYVVKQGTTEVATGSISSGSTASIPGLSDTMNLDPYSVEVTDDSGCVKTMTADIGTRGVSASVSSTPATCENVAGQLIITPTVGNPSFTILVNGTTETRDLNVAATFDLVSDTYDITVTDSAGCSFTTSETVAPYTNVTANIDVTQITCSSGPGSLGSLLVSISEGSGMFDVELLDGSYSQLEEEVNQTSDVIFSDLQPGDYIVRARDSEPCTFFVERNITLGTDNELSLIFFDRTCSGDGSATVDIQITGGQPDFDLFQGVTLIQGSVSGTSLVRANVAFDTPIDFRVVDAINCEFTETRTFTNVQDPISSSSSSADSACRIGPPNTGTVTVSVSGGTPNYNVTLSGVSSAIASEGVDLTFTGVPAGEYNITIVDSNLCVTKTTEFVDSAEPLYAEVNEKVPVVCRNSPTAQLTIASLSGGTGLITLRDVFPPTLGGFDFGSYNIYGAVGGVNYTVTVGDEVGCTHDVYYVPVNPPELFTPLTVTRPVTCFGDLDGEVLIAITGGEGPYVVTVNPPPASGVAVQSNIPQDTNVTISGLGSSTYNINITDTRGCSKEIRDIVLDEPGLMELLLPRHYDVWYMYTPYRIEWRYFGGGRDDRVDVLLEHSNGLISRIFKDVSAFRGASRGLDFTPHHLIPGIYAVRVNGTCLDEQVNKVHLRPLQPGTPASHS